MVVNLGIKVTNCYWMIMKNLILSATLIIFSFSVNAGEVMYKCTGEESGGFNQEKEGPELTKFYLKDYRIVPFSQIPDEAIRHLILFDSKNNNTSLGRIAVSKNLTIKEIREIYLTFANSNTKETDFGEEEKDISKEGLLFVRKTDNDPKSGIDYISCKESILTQKGGSLGYHLISCSKTTMTSSEVFLFESGYFVASNTNTRYVDNKRKYYGDSSSFTFGTCQKYFD